MRALSFAPTVAILGLTLPFTALADTLVVPDDYGSIQGAVDAAAPGDTIRVHSGTYEAFVVTTDGLTIKGAEGEPMPVVVSGVGYFFPAVKVASDDVTIQGLHATSGFILSVGFEVNGTGTTIEGNRASGGHVFGFLELGANNSSFKNNEAEVASPVLSTVGFVVRNSSGSEYVGNLALRCDVGFIVGVFLPCTDITFKENRAVECSNNGFHARRVVDSTFKDNLATDCQGNGFFLAGYGAPAAIGTVFRANKVTGNGGDGFEVWAGSEMCDFRDNVAESNEGYGYHVAEIGSHVFLDNSSADNVLGSSNQPGI